MLQQEFNGVRQHHAFAIRELQRWKAADRARDVPGSLKTVEELLAWIDEFHASQDNHNTVGQPQTSQTLCILDIKLIHVLLCILKQTSANSA
jgi:hypothetical protein